MIVSTLLRKVLLFSLFAGALNAQIVNIEQLRFQKDSSTWSFQDDLSFDIFKNTQEVIDIENQFLLRYQKGSHQLLFANGLHFNFSSQVDFAQSAYLHLRYVQRWSKWWEMEYFSQMQADRPLKIERRLLYGVGPRFGIDQKGDFQFHTGHLIMFEDDRERETGIRHLDWRLSSYISLLWKYKDRFQWTSITYYQPRFDDWSDWRMSLQNQLAFSLGKQWAFTVSAQLNYDARPVVDPQISQLTYKIENGLQLRF